MLPVESILLRALAAPDQTVAAQQWTSSLSIRDLTVAAGRIQAYPFAYRRAIMGALSADQRAAIWQNHIQGYIQTHPELDGDTVGLLQAAQALASPDAFAGPNAIHSAAVSVVASQIQAALGKDVTDYLLYRLGPKDLVLSSNALPLRERLANFVRDEVALAFAEDCDCSQDFGCEGGRCDGSTGCTPDTTWPMCGWFWNQECDGSCRNGIAK
jgi:hypothetical protein